MTEMVIALLMIINGEIIEHRISRFNVSMFKR